MVINLVLIVLNLGQIVIMINTVLNCNSNNFSINCIKSVLNCNKYRTKLIEFWLNGNKSEQLFS